MILVGATNDERSMVLYLGDDASGKVLFSAKFSPDRADTLISQMQLVVASLDRGLSYNTDKTNPTSYSDSSAGEWG